jgi:RNA polymerase sigma-70 factor (ECF subfamily)
MMTSTHLDDAVRRLNDGDLTAAEEIFRIYEPYLRMVVRRKLSQELRTKFDSVDIVQSAWADLWDGFRRARWKFPDAIRLRGFLVKATLNRLIDHVRQQRQAMTHERGMQAGNIELVAVASERPSEEVQMHELWDQLLAACPAEHHQLLRLKQQGLSSAEIAAQVGLHESSVRRIINDVWRRFNWERNRERRTVCGPLPDVCLPNVVEQPSSV